MRNHKIDTSDENGAALRIDFEWRKDRYGHTISRIDSSGAATPLFQSIESGTDDDWPDSPPLQTLSIEEMPDSRKVALLVGMAGHAHWSASIEPIPNHAEMIFDVACRHSDRPRYLGSQYRILASGEKLAVIRGLDLEIQQQAESLRIQPQSTTYGSPTTRWKYVISLRST